ncbi:hypothetical protein B0H19DRAFT_1184168 [Mycena capillaripes]|nr:hypothetical protein B0H19DRAFT_1184168 [Mycena capillaripes]
MIRYLFSIIPRSSFMSAILKTSTLMLIALPFCRSPWTPTVDLVFLKLLEYLASRFVNVSDTSYLLNLIFPIVLRIYLCM